MDKKMVKNGGRGWVAMEEVFKQPFLHRGSEDNMPQNAILFIPVDN